MRRCVRADDRGATLVETVVAMAMVTVVMGAVVGLLTNSSSVASSISADDPLAGVAVDWVVNDLRRSSDVEVVDVADGAVVTIDITTPEGVVRWTSEDGTVLRTAADQSVGQPIVDGLHPDHALQIEFRSTDGTAVDATDAAAIDRCARMVHAQLVDVDAAVVHERAVALRSSRWTEASC